MDIGGYHIEQYFKDLLIKKGYNIENNKHDMDIINDMKEKLSFVSLNFNHDMDNYKSKIVENQYKLKNGTNIILNNEEFKCTEALFDPSLLGLEFDGIDKIILNSVRKSAADLQTTLLQNIILSGGNSMFSGLQARLHQEISQLESEVVVSADPEREYSAWLGGSVLGSLGVYDVLKIRKDEYYECGPSIVSRKCF